MTQDGFQQGRHDVKLDSYMPLQRLAIFLLHWTNSARTFAIAGTLPLRYRLFSSLEQYKDDEYERTHAFGSLNLIDHRRI